MSFETLSVERADDICTVRFTRPRAGNAINAAFLAELSAVVAVCAAADGQSVLVLHG